MNGVRNSTPGEESIDRFDPRADSIKTIRQLKRVVSILFDEMEALERRLEAGEEGIESEDTEISSKLLSRLFHDDEVDSQLAPDALAGPDALDWGPSENIRKEAFALEQEQFSKLMQKSLLVTAQELAEMLGLGVSAISEAYRDGRLFRVQLGKTRLYPSFFASHPAGRKTIEKVCRELGGLPGSVKLHFFMTPRVSLDGQTPLSALEKEDGLKQVLKAAKAERDG